MTTSLPQNFNPAASYSPTMAARMLQVNRSSIYNFIKDGRLDVTIGRKKQTALVTGKSILRYFNTR